MSAPSGRRRAGQGSYFTYSGPASLEQASVSLLLGFYLCLMEISLWANPCAEHFISISLHFYKTLTRHSF